MFKRVRIPIAILVLFMTAYVVAEEILTNETVVKMVKAKLGDTLIIGKIKTSKTNFDLSTDAIINLKSVGVSEKVIEAMLGGAASVIQPTDKPQEKVLNGDFFLLQNGNMVEIEEHGGYRKANYAKAFFTMGIAGDVSYRIGGSKARLRIPASKDNLVFISKIKIDPYLAQGGDLLKLMTKGEIRFFVCSSSGFSTVTAEAGVPKQEYKIKYETKKNSDGTYTITTAEPLVPGEYAFVATPTQSGIRIFDFGVDGEIKETQNTETGKKQE